MKPAQVINRGDTFRTLRVTTESPIEIREALAAREVSHVFKGDQNQAWDAVLANHCLARAVGEDGATDLTFFVHDERLGTSDSRLTRLWRERGRRFVLTEDYYRGRTGAVWEHQDASYGLFFGEAVSPEQYAAAGVHLHRAAALWERHAAELALDSQWVRALAALGVVLPGAPGPAADRSTRLGSPVEAEVFRAYCADHPGAALYYAFTKTDGLYGLVPVENENLALSGIPAADPEVWRALQHLLVRVAGRGAMRNAGSRAQRRGVARRVRHVAEWARNFLHEHPDASVADLQAAFGGWLTRELFPSDRIELDRSSRFTRVQEPDLGALACPEATLHFFLDLCLRHPAECAAAYNAALNRVGFGLQRMKHEPESGLTTLPFFVEYSPDGPGGPIYRFELELSGIEQTRITLRNAGIGDRVVEVPGRVRSVQDLSRALLEGLGAVEGVSLVGKAAMFSAELQRSPRGLGLPRQGSKYTPLVDHLIADLRSRGLLRGSAGLLIRIGLNALDRLDAMGDLPLRLPRFLRAPLGGATTCRHFAAAWRGVAAEARASLHLLGACHVGQHVHLARVLLENCGDLAPLPGVRGPAKVRAQFAAADPDARRGARLGMDLPPETRQVMLALLEEREHLLAARRRAAAAAPGHLRDRAEDARREHAREAVECALLLLVAAYVRRLWQQAESLPYINDRPYTLALYLLFGTDIFPPICRRVEFDVEYLAPPATA